MGFDLWTSGGGNSGGAYMTRGSDMGPGKIGARLSLLLGIHDEACSRLLQTTPKPVCTR